MEDWAPGDKAVCIKAGTIMLGPPRRPSFHYGTGLVEDKIYHVYDTTISTLSGQLLLCLEEFKGEEIGGLRHEAKMGSGARMAMRFRKIRHDPLEGHGEDFAKLRETHRSKQPAPKSPAKPEYVRLPYLPPEKGDTL